MIVTTESGTRYEFDNNKVRRLAPDYGSMRRDGDWLEYTIISEPVIGEPMVLVLEPLGEGYATIRRSTPVERIVE